METRPTKENIDSIMLAVRRLRTSNLKILKEQRKTNEFLEKLLEIERARDMKISVTGKSGHCGGHG